MKKHAAGRPSEKHPAKHGPKQRRKHAPASGKKAAPARSPALQADRAGGHSPEKQALPAQMTLYSQQELAFGELISAALDAIAQAYDRGLTRKQLRRESGLKKKAFRLAEGMDPDARFGDVLNVLAAAHKTLRVVDLDEKPDGPAGGSPPRTGGVES